MSAAHGGGWRVHLPAAGIDAYLAATLFLLELDDGALVLAPDRTGAASDADPRGAESVHARTLLEAVPAIDPRCPGPVALRAGLGLVLIEPTPDVLEALDPQAFPTDPEVMMLLSPADSDRRTWQDSWLWAQRHEPLDLSRCAGRLDPRAIDPAHVLTDHEVWALAVRARARNATALRLSRQPATDGGPARVGRLTRWRA